MKRIRLGVLISTALALLLALTAVASAEVKNYNDPASGRLSSGTSWVTCDRPIYYRSTEFTPRPGTLTFVAKWLSFLGKAAINAAGIPETPTESQEHLHVWLGLASVGSVAAVLWTLAVGSNQWVTEIITLAGGPNSERWVSTALSNTVMGVFLLLTIPQLVGNLYELRLATGRGFWLIALLIQIVFGILGAFIPSTLPLLFVGTVPFLVGACPGLPLGKARAERGARAKVRAK